MTDSPDDDGPEFGLPVPFLACVTNGGPYDDESFDAGWRCGALDFALRSRNYVYMEEISLTALAEQVALIAMDRGYTVVARPAGEGIDEWTHYAFTRADR